MPPRRFGGPLRSQPRTSGERPHRLTLDEYSKKYEEYLEMQREDGILAVGIRNGDGWTPVWNQAWRDIGNDPDTKVVILTAVGDAWLDVPGTTVGSTSPANELLAIFREGMQSLEHLVFTMGMPTIGVVNGPAAPGIHLELALMCDITLCSNDAVFREMHPEIGVAPGDGQFLAMQQLMGHKRAAYYAYTGDGIEAEEALRFGLVSEVCEKTDVHDRAWQIARSIAAMSDAGRYMTTQIVRRPWRKALVDELGFHLSHEMFGAAVDLIGGAGDPSAKWGDAYRRAREINAASAAKRASRRSSSEGTDA